jgi:hypothetical protein
MEDIGDIFTFGKLESRNCTLFAFRTESDLLTGK